MFNLSQNCKLMSSTKSNVVTSSNMYDATLFVCEFYLNSAVQHNNYAIPYHPHFTTIEIQNGKHVGNVFMIHNSKKKSIKNIEMH